MNAFCAAACTYYVYVSGQHADKSQFHACIIASIATVQSLA